MRRERQMFPLRQLLRSAAAKGERRGCIWFSKERKEEKGRTREERKAENFILPRALSTRARPFLVDTLQRDIQPCTGVSRLSCAVRINATPRAGTESRCEVSITRACSTRSRLKLKLIAPYLVISFGAELHAKLYIMREARKIYLRDKNPITFRLAYPRRKGARRRWPSSEESRKSGGNQSAGTTCPIASPDPGDRATRARTRCAPHEIYSARARARALRASALKSDAQVLLITAY